jgi:hypothetical protein
MPVAPVSDRMQTELARPIRRDGHYNRCGGTPRSGRKSGATDVHDHTNAADGDPEVPSPPEAFLPPVGGDQRIVFRGVDWHTYTQLSESLGDDQHVHLIHDGKDLEIMVIGNIHDIIKDLISRIVNKGDVEVAEYVIAAAEQDRLQSKASSSNVP